ncbi:hypothetical protein BH24ACT15_BH24ACT15_37350 [soil metagenome]
MALNLNRRQLLQGTGVMAAAAAMSPLMQSAAFAAPAQGLTAYGASVCAGLGLGSPRRTPPTSTWFDQTALALGLRLPGMENPNAINGAIPGTTLKASLDEQALHPERSTWGQFFWGGHADVSKGGGYTVVGNLRKMSQKYPGSPYLILGITNGKVGGIDGGIESAYYIEAIKPEGINDQLAAEHGPNRFFDVQAFLADPSPNGALALSKIKPTAADNLAFDEKRVPPSLRPEKSQVHLNLIGQTRVAEKVTARVRAANWFT